MFLQVQDTGSVIFRVAMVVIFMSGSLLILYKGVVAPFIDGLTFPKKNKNPESIHDLSDMMQKLKVQQENIHDLMKENAMFRAEINSLESFKDRAEKQIRDLNNYLNHLEKKIK